MNDDFRDSAIHTLAEILLDNKHLPGLRDMLRLSIADLAGDVPMIHCKLRLRRLRQNYALGELDKVAIDALIAGCD